MAESFVGKWKVDLATTTGLEEFGAALGFDADRIEKLKQLDYSLEFGLSGDTITAIVSFEADFPTHTYTFKLGDTIDYYAMDGSKPKLTITMDGGKLVEDYKLGQNEWRTVRQVDGNVMTSLTITMDGGKLVEDYKLGQNEWRTVRQVDGNVMTSTTTAAGKSAVQKLNKQ